MLQPGNTDTTEPLSQSYLVEMCVVAPAGQVNTIGKDILLNFGIVQGLNLSQRLIRNSGHGCFNKEKKIITKFPVVVFVRKILYQDCCSAQSASAFSNPSCLLEEWFPLNNVHLQHDCSVKLQAKRSHPFSGTYLWSTTCCVLQHIMTNGFFTSGTNSRRHEEFFRTA